MGSNNQTSRHRKRSPNLCHLPPHPPGNRDAHDQRLVEIRRILGRRLRSIHHDHWSDNLVRDVEDKAPAVRYLERPASDHTVSASAKGTSPSPCLNLPHRILTPTQQFNCCGYANSTSPPFVTDNTCPNPIVAASQNGCVSPFSTFANNFLDVVFTGAFGIVGIDVVFVLATAMLLKDRKEKERYRGIDEKSGTGSF